MKRKDDGVVATTQIASSPGLKLRRLFVLVICPACSLLLIMVLVVDALPRRSTIRDEHRQSQSMRSEHALTANAGTLGQELGTSIHWPASRAYGKVPCALNVSGYACSNAYGAAMNSLYLLDSALDANRLPAYRSMEGYWLVHSPHRCFERGIWLISKSRPDESDQSASAKHGGCDLEAHIFHSAKLPIGNLGWS